MKEIHITEEPKGTYSCDIGVSSTEWQEILANPDITTTNYKDALMAFYNEPGHKSTCKILSMKHYGNAKDAQKFNSWITNFGKAVVKHLNRFHIVEEDGRERFWHVTMCKGHYLEDDLFETTLRPEIVQAIENLGWNKKMTWIPFYIEMADKLLQFKEDRSKLLDIVYSLDKKYVGYIKAEDGGHVSDIDPFTVFGIFNRGISNDNRIKLCWHLKNKLDIKATVPADFDGVPVVNNMMATFYWRENVKTDIQPLWDIFEAALQNKTTEVNEYLDKVCKQQGIKWNITMGLYWIRPYDYISLDSRNRNYLPSLGIDVFKENLLDGEHYMSLLVTVKDKIATREIKDESIPEISYNAWIQTLGEKKRYWLAGYCFGSSDSQLERFLAEGIWEGRFDENKMADQRQLKHVKNIKVGDIILIKSTATKGSNHEMPFMRIKAVGIVTSDCKENSVEGDVYKSFVFNVKYVSTDTKDFDGKKFGAFRQTIHEADDNVMEVIDYANELIKEAEGEMTANKYQKYIDLLKETKNLVLTGAPGTGKTFMAKAIAKEMEAEYEFVQFHPSYDYTDFVEGLRPMEKEDGQMSFERKDGVFKEFCKRAIENLEESSKGSIAREKEQNVGEAIADFLTECLDNNTKLYTKPEKNAGRDFYVTNITGQALFHLYSK